VQVGPWYGNEWFIDDGLAPGDVVIVEGVARVSPGAPVRITEAQPRPGTTPATKPAAAKP
jgi:membrane fusion protein (multidrug efflux system)